MPTKKEQTHGVNLFSLIMKLGRSENPEQAQELLENEAELVDEGFLFYFDDPQQAKFTATFIHPEQKFRMIRQLGLELFIRRLVHQFLITQQQYLAEFFMQNARFFIHPFATNYLDQILREVPPALQQSIRKAREQMSLLAGTILLNQPEAGSIAVMINSNPGIFSGDGAAGFYREIAESADPLKHKALLVLQLIADIAFNTLIKAVKTPLLLEKLNESEHPDIKKKIGALEEALKLAAEEEPVNKAMIHFYLASALLEDRSVNRVQHIERAIGYFHEAGRWFTRSRAPFAWARVQNGLGRCYGEYQKGHAQENLDTSITYLQQAAEVFDPILHPYDWGYAMNNLGSAYLRKTNGDMTAHLHKAVDFLEKARTVLTKEFVPEGWALCITNLGEAYSNNQWPNRVEMCQKAILLYKEVIELYQQHTHPYQWAMLQMRIGGAFVNMSAENPSIHIESALAYLQEALKILRYEQYPDDWATLLRYMGDAFAKRVKGDALVNQESAIRCYTDSFAVTTIHTAPFGWATLHMQLALLNSRRIRGDKTDNMATAFRHLREARLVLKEETYPEDWAAIEHLEGILWLEHRKPNLPEDWEKAIVHFENSLKYRNTEENMHGWSRSMNSLAAAYLDRSDGDKASNQRKAVQLYEKALRHLAKEHDALAWCIITADLGRAYTRLTYGDVHDHEQKAISCFRSVLDIQTPDTHPLECYKVAYMLGDLYYRRQDFSSAAQSFAQCFKSSENLRQQSVHDFYRSLISMEAAQLYEKLVSCELALSNIGRAAFYVMAGKARVFTDQLRESTVNSSASKNTDKRALKMKLSIDKIREEIDDITSSREFLATGGQFVNTDRVTLSSLVAKKRKQLAELIEELSLHFPDMPESGTMPVITTDQLKELSRKTPNTVLVEYYHHDKGWCAFVIEKGFLRFAHLPDVNNELLETVFNTITECEATALAGKDPNKLNDQLLPLLMQLHSTLISPLLLSPGENIHCVMALSQELTFMPVNIALNKHTKRFFAEDFGLSFIPSLGAWYRLAQQGDLENDAQHNRRLLSIVYPGHSKGSYLRFAEEECKLLINHFPNLPVLLDRNEATVQAAIAHCNRGDFSLVHFVCHGQFNGTAPEHSGLSLADGILTAERVRAQIKLAHRPTVILSACQSGQASVSPGDHAVGLVQSFFAAGAGMVLASQWAVNDQSTLALFTAYFNLLKDLPPPEALKRAMTSVRETAGWEHPVFWAAFTITGRSR